MSFTAQEIQNIANSVIEFHRRGPVDSQAKQIRPLYDDLRKAQEPFGGGNEYITGRVKGVYSSAYQGYTHDDEVAYGNPANIKQWRAKWYELHSGIQITGTELKIAGVRVVDTTTGERTTNQPDQELFALTKLLDDKVEDMEEGSARSFAEMLWRDGTQDAKAVPGIRSFILDAPTAGTTFGIDRAPNSWWRNRASLGIVTTTPGDQNVVTRLQAEMRQLRRFGAPKHKAYAGSDFMSAFEGELRSKGNYTLDGWDKKGMIDASIADIAFKGVPIQYEPLLDDLGLSKYLYMLDLNKIKLAPIRDEDGKLHFPARPPEKYVYYRAITWTGALIAKQLNTSGVYSIA